MSPLPGDVGIGFYGEHLFDSTDGHDGEVVTMRGQAGSSTAYPSLHRGSDNTGVSVPLSWLPRDLSPLPGAEQAPMQLACGNFSLSVPFLHEAPQDQEVPGCQIWPPH